MPTIDELESRLEAIEEKISQDAAKQDPKPDLLKLLTEDIQAHRTYVQSLYRNAVTIGGAVVAIGVALALYTLGEQLDASVFEYRIVDSLKERAQRISEEIVDDATQKAREASQQIVTTEIATEVEKNIQGRLTELTTDTLETLVGQITFPTGMVVAINRADCPQGWAAFETAEGRFIVGAATTSVSPLTRIEKRYRLGQSGGSETHTLTLDEMPTHTHGAAPVDYTEWDAGGGKYSTDTTPNGHRTGEARELKIAVSPAGGGQPHNNMPPYVALLWCQKS